jgi:hypothetical protein
MKITHHAVPSYSGSAQDEIQSVVWMALMVFNILSTVKAALKYDAGKIASGLSNYDVGQKVT